VQHIVGIMKDPAGASSSKSVKIFNHAEFFERDPSSALHQNDTAGRLLVVNNENLSCR
jgi:hypothetical protein